MHALSLGTWWIHWTSVLEWVLAIVLLQQLARLERAPRLNGLALAMIPALVSAMAACSWHLTDNSEVFRALVLLQALFTLVGNCCMAFAAWNLQRTSRA